MRMLLVESVKAVKRLDEGFRKQYQHRCHHKAKAVQGGGSAKISRATLPDAAQQHAVSGDRSHRGQLAIMAWSAQARPVN